MGLFNNTARLTFLENLDNKGYYMMFLCSPETAQKRYEQYTRTGRYDETGMAEPYGYPEFNIGSPICNKLPLENERQGELLLTYIKNNKISNHNEIVRAEAWGWFKFSEDINIEKWLREYVAYETKRQQENIKTSNSGLQTAMF